MLKITDFIKMKTTLILLLSATVRVWAALETNITTIEWIYDPVQRLSIASNEQIGFRSDGVVVWRTCPRLAVTNIAWASLLVCATNNRVITITATNHLSTEEEVFKEAAKSGKICKYIGHCWEEHIHVTLEGRNGADQCRQCRLCKLHQWHYTKDEWK